jgi:hypothetical protein
MGARPFTVEVDGHGATQQIGFARAGARDDRLGALTSGSRFFVKFTRFCQIYEFSSDHALLRSCAVLRKHRPCEANSLVAPGSYGSRNRQVYNLL